MRITKGQFNYIKDLLTSEQEVSGPEAEGYIQCILDSLNEGDTDAHTDEANGLTHVVLARCGQGVHIASELD